MCKLSTISMTPDGPGAAQPRFAHLRGAKRGPAWGAFGLALVLLEVAFVPPAEAAKKPRLAVLYFDNNTSNKKLDVLQKGLADMFITDLASVPGLVVVERDKLQAVISELKLQRSRYFNKRSSVKIGKQLGATHVVSGNFAVVAKTIRIGARLIQVKTGRVLLGTRVTGPTTSIFDLEQQLVARFVAGFHKAKKQGLKILPAAVRPKSRVGTYRFSSRRRTKIPDVATLVDYSKGLDLVDKGMLRAASLRLAAVAAKAPTFRLAKQRIGELKRHVKHAGIVRAATLGAQAKALRNKAVAFVRGHGPDAKDVQEAKLYLAYSEVLDAFARYDLSKVLAPRSPNLILPGKRPAALALVKRVINRKITLIKDFTRYAKRHTKVFPNGMRSLDTYIRLAADDQAALREAKLGARMHFQMPTLTLNFARFLLLGRASGGWKGSFYVSPPPSRLFPRYEKLGFSLLHKLIKDQDKKAKGQGGRLAESYAIRARMLWGEALLLRGKRDAAVSKWQEVLDRYPTSTRYRFVERKIKEQLGLKYHFQTKRLQRYVGGLKSCKDMELRVGIGIMMTRRVRLLGLRGISETVKEVEKACRAKSRSGKAHLRNWWSYLYTQAALMAGRASRCKLFDKWIKQAVVEGLGQGSADAYRRNYTSCP